MSNYRQDLAYIQAVAYGGPARSAAPEIVRRLCDASVGVRHVVDAGCGAGPLTHALVDAGFEVTAIDSSSELVAMARAAAPGARFINASMYDAELPACEAVLAVGEPLTYHNDDRDRVHGFFERVASVLPEGGLFIFDLIELGEPSLNARTWSSDLEWAVFVETMEDQATRRLVRDIQTFRRDGELYRRGHEVHHVRLFDSQTICTQLVGCGFAVETAQAYGAQPLPPRRRAFFATLSSTPPASHEGRQVLRSA